MGTVREPRSIMVQVMTLSRQADKKLLPESNYDADLWRHMTSWVANDLRKIKGNKWNDLFAVYDGNLVSYPCISLKFD